MLMYREYKGNNMSGDDSNKTSDLESARQSSEECKKPKDGEQKASRKFEKIVDRFGKLGEVTKEIKRLGIDECGVILGIDYTMSNRDQGKRTFGGLNLHDLSTQNSNPYQEVICILGETLRPKGGIPVYGFGDVTDRDVFVLKTEGNCEDFNDVLDVYRAETPNIKMAGPTNFAPLINTAVNIVKKTKKYHILVIVADGQATEEEETEEAIVEASKYPLSIILIGVGDGPWGVMNEFDDLLPQRVFDNFQFVDFHSVKEKATRCPSAAVALAILMEIPDQYQAIKKLKLLDNLS